MGKYFALQLKRVLRYLPGALCVMGLLLGGLFAALNMMLQQDAAKEENQKFPVAICGETDNVFLQMGLTMVTSMDSSRYTLDIRQMETDAAKKALAGGEIAAYVEIPDGFMEAAFAGELIPLNMVSTAGASGIVSIFKEELTDVIGDILTDSEKGVFGLENAMWDQGQGRKIGNRMDRLALKYVDYIVLRDQVYTLEELGIADQLDLRQYLICGLTVLFAMLACLPFAPLQIRQDPALGRLLRAKGYSALWQTLLDFAAYALTLFIIAGLLLPLLRLLGNGPISANAVLQGIPVVLMVAAYSFLLFSLSGDLMTGVLMQFFLTLGLCFVSGCIYPTYFFPVEVQKWAAFLPAGLARTQLAGCFTGSAAATWHLLGYTAAFLGISIYARSRKIRGVAP